MTVSENDVFRKVGIEAVGRMVAEEAVVSLNDSLIQAKTRHAELIDKYDLATEIIQAFSELLDDLLDDWDETPENTTDWRRMQSLLKDFDAKYPGVRYGLPPIPAQD